MELEFDSRKNTINIVKHGIGFEQVTTLDWSKAATKLDCRADYGEIRYLTYAPLNSRIYMLVWTLRDSAVRPISFRKANIKERKRYEKEKNAES
ncbi:MAG: BrnT family toxin [Rickettsiales bacterium]